MVNTITFAQPPNSANITLSDDYLVVGCPKDGSGDVTFAWELVDNKMQFIEVRR